MNVSVLWRSEDRCDLLRYLLLKPFELHFHVLKLLPGVHKLLTLLLSETKAGRERSLKKRRKWKKRSEDVT